MAELKPCPFCGANNPIITRVDFLGNYIIQCDTCSAKSGLRVDEQAAIDAWNKRK